MCLVVCRIKPSVNAAYLHLEEFFDASVQSVYNKINKVEPEVSRQLVCQTASSVKAVIDELGVFNDSPIPGYEVRIVDGNHDTSHLIPRHAAHFHLKVAKQYHRSRRF